VEAGRVLESTPQALAPDAEGPGTEADRFTRFDVQLSQGIPFIGELTRAGLPVPAGVCVTTDAYRQVAAAASGFAALLEGIAAASPTDTARLATLEAIETAVWRELAAAAQDRGHAWRFMALATVDGDGVDARTVVLRETDARRRELVLAALSFVANTAIGYIFLAYLLAYGTAVLKLSRSFMLVVVIIGSVVWLVQQRRQGNWTADERTHLRDVMRSASSVSPYLFIWVIPGSMLILPFMAWFLDRQRKRRERKLRG